MSLRIAGPFVILWLVAGWLFLGSAGPGFPLDDTWGHMVYARALATGEGFAYNPGTAEAGVTSPLWTTLAAIPVGIAEWIGHGGRPDWGLRLLGGFFGLLSVLVGFRLGARAGRWPASFAAILLAVDPLLLAGSYSGMELSLFTLLMLLLAEALVDENISKAGLVLGLAVLTRPEALILLPVAAALLWRHRRRTLAFLLPVVLLAAPFAAWNIFVTGNPWPNTWQNKAQFVLNLPAIGDTLTALGRDTGWGWALPLLLASGAFALEGAARRMALVLGSLGAALLIGVLFTREMPVEFNPPRVPFYWERYALLAWPPLLVLLAAGLASLVRTAWAGLFCRPLAAALLVSPLLVIGWLARDVPAHMVDVTQRFAAECADVEALNVAAGLWVRENLPEGALVAAHDAGAIRYFGRRPVLDIYGNNDHRLNALIVGRDRALGEHARNSAEQAISDYLLQQQPDALAVFPASWASAHSPEFAALMADATPEEQVILAQQVQDYAGPLGLTKRAVTFHVANPAVINSPLHQDLAIFVRP